MVEGMAGGPRFAPAAPSPENRLLLRLDAPEAGQGRRTCGAPAPGTHKSDRCNGPCGWWTSNVTDGRPGPAAFGGRPEPLGGSEVREGIGARC